MFNFDFLLFLLLLFEITFKTFLKNIAEFNFSLLNEKIHFSLKEKYAWFSIWITLTMSLFHWNAIKNHYTNFLCKYVKIENFYFVYNSLNT